MGRLAQQTANWQPAELACCKDMCKVSTPTIKQPNWHCSHKHHNSRQGQKWSASVGWHSTDVAVCCDIPHQLLMVGMHHSQRPLGSQTSLDAARMTASIHPNNNVEDYKLHSQQHQHSRQGHTQMACICRTAQHGCGCWLCHSPPADELMEDAQQTATW